MRITKITALLTAAVSLVSVTAGCGSSAKKDSEGEAEASAMRDITTMELVHDMGIGINLGNTFEAWGGWITSGNVNDYETCWGSPIITEEIIQGYANDGFGVLRVPVAWSNMMDSEYNIDQSYIDRVKEVVGWAIDDGMYVIMNIHWDGGWWEQFPDDYDKCMTKYTKIWTQLCDNFGEFNDYLMFESLNEEGGWDSLWNRYTDGDTEGKHRSYEILNNINQTFVDIVRESGGNNAERHLLIAGYNTDVDLTCDELFVMPDDPAGRCAVSVHYYTPSTFCILDSDADWGQAKTAWGSPRDYAEMEKYLDKVKERFVDNGVPVIVGEYGAVAIRNKTAEQVRNYNIVACTKMYERGLCPVLWDITDVFYDRHTCQFKDREMLEGMLEATGQ